MAIHISKDASRGSFVAGLPPSFPNRPLATALRVQNPGSVPDSTSEVA
jgi:hypothetical protein